MASISQQKRAQATAGKRASRVINLKKKKLKRFKMNLKSEKFLDEWRKRLGLTSQEATDLEDI